MQTQATRNAIPLRARSLVATAASILLFAPSVSSAHAIAGDRVFPSTMAVDDPGVGDEANFEYGHQRVPGDNGDQSINTFDFEYDKLITPRLAVSVDGTYAMQSNPKARGFDNFGVGFKYLLYVNEEHEFMTSVGVDAELGGTGSRAIADNFSTISPTIYAGKGMGDLPDSLAYLRPIAVTGEAGPALTTGAGQPNAFNYGFTVQYSLPYLQQHVHDIACPSRWRTLFLWWSFRCREARGRQPARSIRVSSGSIAMASSALKRRSRSTTPAARMWAFWCRPTFSSTMSRRPRSANLSSSNAAT